MDRRRESWTESTGLEPDTTGYLEDEGTCNHEYLCSFYMGGVCSCSYENNNNNNNNNYLKCSKTKSIYGNNINSKKNRDTTDTSFDNSFEDEDMSTDSYNFPVSDSSYYCPASGSARTMFYNGDPYCVDDRSRGSGSTYDQYGMRDSNKHDSSYDQYGMRDSNEHESNYDQYGMRDSNEHGSNYDQYGMRDSKHGSTYDQYGKKDTSSNEQGSTYDQYGSQDDQYNRTNENCHDSCHFSSQQQIPKLQVTAKILFGSVTAISDLKQRKKSSKKK